MLGAGLQFNTSGKGEDRFYSAARIRLIQDYLCGARSDVTSNRLQSRSGESEQENSKEEVLASPPLCNLERFLESVTPSVSAQYFSKTEVRTWRTSGLEFQPFFVLGDLWESFKEWSVYGVGVPLVLNDRDCVVQYYVPYLSGIQLYVDLSKSSAELRQNGEESDGEYIRDSCSDGSSDNELNHPWEHRNHIQTSDISLVVDQLSLREQHSAFHEGFSSDDGESGCSPGYLLFEYLERDQPYCREPLVNKISDLALRFPKLKTLRSCDLLLSSWLSVAWYPIYRIPMGPTLRDLDACFLTYHSLHTPLTGSQVLHIDQLSLPAFGLASYKFREHLWTSNTEHHRQLARDLLQDADNLLNKLQVHHPDFSFFHRK